MQLTASQCWLQQIRRIHRTFGIARANDGVQFVDEHDDLTIGALHFFQHGLQSIFELTAILRTRYQSAHVESEDTLVLEVLRNVSQHDAVSKAFDDGGLADARFTDEHRVVLAAARKNLDDSTDLGVASDDRIDLAFASQLDKILAVLLEGLELVFGRSDPARSVLLELF
jgi:hypothetical protein